MPRTIADVEADLAALKESGVDMRSAKAKALREEKAALATPPVEASTETLSTAIPDYDFPAAAPPADPFASDEWAFVQKACAAIELEPDGRQTGLAKKFYQRLMYQVEAWRTARAIIAQVGVGGKWPSWTSLGRDDNTGAPLPPKPVRPSIPAGPPVVTEGGMPIGPGGSAVEAQLAEMRASAAAATAAMFASGPPV